jgi:hypothetical protein
MNDKLPSAHAETISIDTAYPLYYGNPNSASDTLQGEIVTNDNTSIGMRFIPESNVIAVTKKGPSLYQPFGFTNTDIDIDMSLFKNTCLENIVLTDNEIGLLRDKLKYVKNPKKFIKDIMPYYCDVRNIILSHMDNFEEIYPSLFSQVLYKSLENPDSRDNNYIQDIINLLLNNNTNELKIREINTRSNPGSRRLESIFNSMIPSVTRLSKRTGGTKRKRKNKRKTKKNKRKLHKR